MNMSFYVNVGVVVRMSEPLLACVHTPGVYCWGIVAAFNGLYNAFLISFIFLEQAHPDSHWPLIGWGETKTDTCKFLYIYQSQETKTLIY